MPRIAAILAASLFLGAGTHPARAQAPSPQPSPGSAATGRASVRLVRLLSEVPDDLQRRSGPLHDIRVQLEPGNVVVFRKGGEFAALLPIERVEGGRADSLRYFYYVEKPAMFWVFAGERTRGILTVAEGGSLQFNSFRLVWGGSEDGQGFLYFPDSDENRRLRFSVVSGHSVDRADPKDTKYWVDLGADDRAGF